MKKTDDLYGLFLEAKKRLQAKKFGKSAPNLELYIVSKELIKTIDRQLELFIEKDFKKFREEFEKFAKLELEKTTWPGSFKGAFPYVFGRRKTGNKNILEFRVFMANNPNPNSKTDGHYVWHIINAGRTGPTFSYVRSVDKKGNVVFTRNKDSITNVFGGYPVAISKAPAVYHPYIKSQRQLAPRTTPFGGGPGGIRPTKKQFQRERAMKYYEVGSEMPGIHPRNYYAAIYEKITDFISAYNKENDLFKYKVVKVKINNRHDNDPGIRLEITWQ